LKKEKFTRVHGDKEEIFAAIQPYQYFYIIIPAWIHKTNYIWIICTIISLFIGKNMCNLPTIFIDEKIKMFLY
jgi:hypothetical protein